VRETKKVEARGSPLKADGRYGGGIDKTYVWNLIVKLV
jgi:hypothetical protein